MKLVSGRILKVVTACGFLSLIIVLILVKSNSPATGYELSIYSALPISVWVFLLAAIFCGILTITHQAIYKKESNFWLTGFLMLILAGVIFYTLPLIRGYYLHGPNDTLYHLTTTSSLVSTGFIRDNYYPVTHILGAIMIQISSLSPEIIVQSLPVVFSLLFMLFVYFLATAVSTKKGHAMLAAAAGTIPLFSYFHVSTYPHSLSLLFFPLLFFLYFKCSRTPSLAWTTIFIIALFVFPFFHPVTEAVLVITLFVGEAARWIWYKRKNSPIQAQGISSVVPIISLATFVTWISYFTVFGSSVRSIYVWIAGEVPAIARAGEIQTVTAKGSMLHIIELGLKMYGYDLLLIFFSLIALGICSIYFLKRQNQNRELFVVSVMSLASILAFFTVAMSVGQVTWGRILGANVGLWASPVLAGFVLYAFWDNPRIRKLIAVAALVTILIFSSAVSIFGLYRSPWIGQANLQITRADISGNAWFNNRPSGIPVATMGWVSTSTPVVIADHFGFPQYVILGESIKQDTFLLLAERFKLGSVDPVLSGSGNIATPEISRPGFNMDDFARIEKDSSVDKLYSNGDWEIFLARSSGE